MRPAGLSLASAVIGEHNETRNPPDRVAQPLASRYDPFGS
jgi:hypothetical protein